MQKKGHKTARTVKKNLYFIFSTLWSGALLTLFRSHKFVDGRIRIRNTGEEGAGAVVPYTPPYHNSSKKLCYITKDFCFHPSCFLVGTKAEFNNVEPFFVEGDPGATFCLLRSGSVSVSFLEYRTQ